MDLLPQALVPLAQYKQFILWKRVDRGNGKQDKLPINYSTTEVTDAHNPQAWTDAQTAIATAKLFGPEYGVGFVFTKNDPFYFLDIDKCADNGQWSDTAKKLMDYLPGAAIEISQSGTGLHIIGTGVCPDHSCKNIQLGLELYTQDRFVALTGTHATGSADMDSSAALTALVVNYFPPKITAESSAWTTGPVAEWSGIADDEKLIAKMLASKSAASAFGSRASFADLFNKNVPALAAIYTPDASDTGEYDESSADAALAQHLAFWTGKDCERIKRIMLKSGLVRKKWDRSDYLMRTITNAVSMQGDVYNNGKVKEPERVPVDPSTVIQGSNEPSLVTGYQYLGITQQLEHFKGCVYIQSIHKIFTPSGSLLKQDQFNATYGGYVFQLDSETSGKTTKKAWEAFTESQAVRFPKAELMCFRPEITSGSLVTHDGRVMVNTYVPIKTPRIKGDATPFLIHLAKVLPDERDRLILTSYMAACIQYKGYKFQWAPLIQGIEGNGKTLFTRCVAFAIGDAYTHMPRADEISEKFNEWLFNTLFIGVEDIYVPDHKREIMEVIKPMVTSDRLACRAMQTAQVMKDVRCNFIFNTNLKDGLRKSMTDRRFCIFYTAQQKPGDIEKDGMAGDYFPKLYRWLKADGYAIVADYLETFQIPQEFNPADLCIRAPETSTTHEAITASLGGIEQEVLEAVEEGRPGFCGGWISSMAFEKLLESRNAAKAIPINKRRELLQTLGYDWHPGLKNGRVNNIIMFDGGKPRLFIKAGHIHINLQSPAEIAKHYQEAQGTPVITPGQHTAFK